MNEMIERVAKALNAVQRLEVWEELRPESREEMMIAARAAIAAMREPTELMLEIANDMVPDQAPAAYYEVMIDVALAEDEGTAQAA